MLPVRYVTAILWHKLQPKGYKVVDAYLGVYWSLPIQELKSLSACEVRKIILPSTRG